MGSARNAHDVDGTLSDLRDSSGSGSSRHGKWKLLSVMLILAICLGIGLWSIQLRPTVEVVESEPPSEERLSARNSDRPRSHVASNGNDAAREISDSATKPPEVISFAPLPRDLEQRVAFLREEISETVETLIGDFPQQANPLSLQALVHSRFNRSDLAIEVWHECLELDPQFVSAHTALGTIALEKDDLDKAESHLRQTLEIRPTDDQARTSLAECLIKQNRPQEAIDLLALDSEVDSPPLINLYHMGQAYAQLGEFDSAVEHYQQAIRRAPNLTYAYYGLGTAYRRLGEPEQAREALHKFQELKQADLETQKERARDADDESSLRTTAAHVHFITGEVYSHAGRLATAVAHWIRAAKLDQQGVRARENLAKIFMQTQDLERVIVILKELRDIESQNPNHRMNLGMAYAQLGQLDAAQSSFMKAIDLSPKSSAALMATAEFLINHQRDLEQARQLAQRGVKLHSSSQNYAILAMACASLQDFPAALRAVEQALERDPENPDFQSFKRQLTARLEHGNQQQ